MGHVVFGRMLREHLRTSAFKFVAKSTSEDSEIHSKVINRVLRPRFPLSFISSRNIDIRRLRADLGYSYLARRLIRRELSRSYIDALHLHTQMVAYLSLDYMRLIPTVISIDQTAMQIAMETPEGWRWTHRPSIEIERAVFREAFAIVAFSKWAADSLEPALGSKIADKVHIVPIGVDVALFEKVRALRAERKTRDTLRILFVGNDFARKGGLQLARVFLQTFAAFDVELHCITNDAAVPAHQKIIVHRNVAAFSESWIRLYSEADVFALPTRAEAFGIVLVEAMAAGLPVVATNINAIPEIIVDEETGLLVPPDDDAALRGALSRLVEDPVLREIMGAQGVERVAERFDSRQTVKRIGGILGEAAQLGAKKREPRLQGGDA